MELFNQQHAASRSQAVRAHYDTKEGSVHPSFLKSLRKAQSQDFLNEIEKEDGSITSDPAEILTRAKDFYSQLYLNTMVRQVEILDESWNSNIESISPMEGDILTLPVTASEVQVAIKKAPLNKSGGPDGLPYEALKMGGELVTRALVKVFNTILQEGIQLEGSNLSRIVLLYKQKGSKTDIKNWRPISLMNCDYKVLISILTSRLNKIANTIFHPSQFGFTPGRDIWENINTVNNVVASKYRNSNGRLLFLDMEKAYDRVSWSFLRASLGACNIPARFINWISGLYRNLEARVVTPIGRSEPIRITQGLRQGDPMLPVLYNFSANILLTMLNTHLNGVICPGQLPLKAIAFADDTVVGISSHLDMFKFGEAIEAFQRMSNAKINASKTITINIGEPTFRLSPLFVNTVHNGTFRHLGVWLGPNGICLRTSEERLFISIHTRMAQWKSRKLTLKGKIRAINDFILSKLWYFSRGISFSETFHSKISGLVSGFLWGGGAKIPIQLIELMHAKKNGGLGLLDWKKHSKELTRPHVLNILQPINNHWSTGAAVILSKVMKVKGPMNPLNLMIWATQIPENRSPRVSYWKNLARYIIEHKWKVDTPRIKQDHLDIVIQVSRGSLSLESLPLDNPVLTKDGANVTKGKYKKPKGKPIPSRLSAVMGAYKS